MKVIICDETLKETEKRKEEMSFKEKLEVAKHLDELCVDILSVGPVKDAKTDSILFRTITTFLKNSTIACACEATKESIDLAVEAIKNANKKIISISFPSSVMQMEYMYHKKPEKMIETISELVSYAKSLGFMVEAVLEDATRADISYLKNAIAAATNSGADYISVIDSAGIVFAENFKKFISEIKKDMKVKLGIGCSNLNFMGNACVFAGLEAGADYVKTSIFGNELPKLGEVATIIANLGDKNNYSMDVDSTKIKATIKEVIKDHETAKKITDGNIVENMNLLDVNTTMEELVDNLNKLGYDLSVSDQNAVYETFIRLARKKNVVKLKELDAIVANVAMQVPQTYKLESYVINSGNIIKSTASVVLIKNNEELFGLSTGDGPIDAAFKAIEMVLGRSFELDDFQIKSTTEGAEAIGEALIKLRYNGKLYSGSGISTDINGASIRAYIQAVNKIVYEDNN